MTNSDARLPKAIKSITVLRTGPDGHGTPVTVYKAKDNQKKQSRGMRGIERLARRNTKAQQAYAETYLRRHQRSNKRHRDGWLRDYTYNMMRAYRDAGKQVKLTKMLAW